MFKVEWAFAGGVTEAQETEEEAVVREAREEIGVDVKVIRKILERKHPNTLVQVAYFYCKPKNNKKPEIGEKYEISQVEWVSPDKVLERFTSDVAPEIKKFILSFYN